MGSAVSTLAPEDICHLQESTHFSLKELQRLYRRFELLDRDRSGTLSPQEVLGIPEFAMNPLTPRLLQMLRINSDQLDFTRFVQYLSVFHKKASRMERLHFAFNMYNLAGDGLIKKEELLALLQMMVGGHITDDQLAHIVDQTFADADADGDGLISFADFASGMESSQSLHQMAISF